MAIKLRKGDALKVDGLVFTLVDIDRGEASVNLDGHGSPAELVRRDGTRRLLRSIQRHNDQLRTALSMKPLTG